MTACVCRARTTHSSFVDLANKNALSRFPWWGRKVNGFVDSLYRRINLFWHLIRMLVNLQQINIILIVKILLIITCTLLFIGLNELSWAACAKYFIYRRYLAVKFNPAIDFPKWWGNIGLDVYDHIFYIIIMDTVLV